ncbi:MAG: bifunctional oligoribonuclease/PAP phosphatase NrnA [Bacillota bacterium]|nr:bifunctional oligoribonuclease/PAP phosphatase NrnA [Bacillota bacterium]
MTAKEVADALLALDKVYILTHVNPDADALGSSFGLCAFLRNHGKTADVVTEKSIPGNYAFMNIKPILKTDANEQRDVIVLDSGDKKRMGECEELFDRASHTIVIDHHGTNEGYGDISFVCGGKSSTGEIIYEIIMASGLEYNKKIAMLLYAAIISDTGGLRYSSTTPDTVRVVAELMEYGLDVAYINRMLFENTPMRKIKLKNLVLSTLRVKLGDKVAIVHATEEMMQETETTDDDTEGFVNIAREIEGVEVGIFLKERSDEIKISIRSNEYVDVSKVSKKMGGGGHFHAGGCSYKGTLEDAEKTVLNLIEPLL